MNVDVPTKRENAIVGLRKVQSAVSGVIGSQKCELAAISKAHSHCDVLVLCTLRIERAANDYRKRDELSGVLFDIGMSFVNRSSSVVTYAES